MTDEQTLPNCIGFIMDGNRRWAKAQGLQTLEGHQKGTDVLKTITEHVRDLGISHAVFYAFSSENWKRNETEVGYLLQLFAVRMEELQTELDSDPDIRKGTRFRFIGDTKQFAPKLQEQITAIESRTKHNTDLTVWIALSYGGRAEIVSAVNRAVENGQPVNESSFTSLLWSEGMPDPDLIIRTGGQQRLSNFLTWQSIYSELTFVPDYWPAFTTEQLDGILAEFQERKRNFGS